MLVASSWSGGKDSCFACYKAMQEGHRVGCLVNFISNQYKRVSFHGVPANLIAKQAECMGIPLLQRETTMENYEAEFKEAINGLLKRGFEGVVFGDIYLQGHKDWVERVCSEIGVKAIEPLWGMATENVYRDFVKSAFQAIVVSAKSNLIGREWLGHSVDEEFLDYLKRTKIDLCGENGEYHTFTTDGPIFRKQIKIIEKKITNHNDHWFVDILRFGSEEKSTGVSSC